MADAKDTRLMGADEPFEVGACCNCLAVTILRNIMMLSVRGPTPGRGWGCVVCDLPPDGAVAILCDECIARDDPPKFVCTGYASEPGRTPYADLDADVFEHDAKAHAADQMDGWGPP